MCTASFTIECHLPGHTHLEQKFGQETESLKPKSHTGILHSGKKCPAEEIEELWWRKSDIWNDSAYRSVGRTRWLSRCACEPTLKDWAA
jgi:hypothetical protein